MSHRVALKETRRDAATQAIDYGVYDNYGRRCGAVVTKYTIDSRAATKDDISYLNLEDIPEDAGPTLYYGNSQVTRDGKLYGGLPYGKWFTSEEARQEWLDRRVEESMKRAADNELYEDAYSKGVNTAKGWRKQSLNVNDERFTPVAENSRKRPGYNPAFGAYRPTR